MTEIIEIKIVGIFTSPEYQRSKRYAVRMHQSLPQKYSDPELVPMLDVAWNEYLTTMRRTVGGNFWKITTPIAVFKNNELIGDDEKLLEIIRTNYAIRIEEDFDEMGCQEFEEYIEDPVKLFVFFSIAIEENIIGSLLFELYVNIAPDTCKNFYNHCIDGYKNEHILRIVKHGWIQFGSPGISQTIPFENFIVPHNKRGVLSMCHDGYFESNSFQFFVTLNPSAWMDKKYVAFGQLIHGEDVLKQLESVQTYYEFPLQQIKIVNCGKYKSKPDIDSDFMEDYKKYLDELAQGGTNEDDLIQPMHSRDVYPTDVSDSRDVSTTDSLSDL